MRYWSAQAACGTTPAGVVAQGPGYGGFYYTAGDLLTYQQTEHLPTNPAALAAWFARYTPPAWTTDSSIAASLIALEWLVPTPPLVRAAAFRALAALPIVTGLGPVPGGQGLLINQPDADGGREELVIDPATALIRSDSTSKATTTIEAANWTNQLPRVVPLCHGLSTADGRALTRLHLTRCEVLPFSHGSLRGATPTPPAGRSAIWLRRRGCRSGCCGTGRSSAW